MAVSSKGRAEFPSQAAAPPALPKGEPSSGSYCVLISVLFPLRQQEDRRHEHGHGFRKHDGEPFTFRVNNMMNVPQDMKGSYYLYPLTERDRDGMF